MTGSGIEIRTVVRLAARNRVTSLILIITLVSSAAMISHASVRVDKSNQSYQQAKSRALYSDDSARKHLDDLTFLMSNEMSFKRMVEMRKIGLVEDMDWLEPLLKISTDINARKFHSRIGDAEPVSILHGKAVQFSSVSRIDIELEFESNHGADVFRFFSDLFVQAPGVFELGELEITRIEASPREIESARKVAITKGQPQIESTWVKTSTAGQFAGHEIPAQHASHRALKVEASVRWFVIQPYGEDENPG